jgi:hypothetical protein
MTLFSAGSGRRFGHADLRLAQDLAQRSALLVDNAKLAGESKCRASRPAWPGPFRPSYCRQRCLACRACCWPPATGEQVRTTGSGDFYDVFRVGRDAWVAIVGDVGGTGPEAAAVTGVVRHCLRAAAQQCPDGASMLETANAVLCDLSDGEQLCCVLPEPANVIKAPGEKIRWVSRTRVRS